MPHSLCDIGYVGYVFSTFQIDTIVFVFDERILIFLTRWNIAVCNFLICLGCVAPRSLRNVLRNWLECSDKSLPGDHYLDFGNNYGLHFPRTLIGEAKVHSSSDILLLCHLRSPNFWYQCKLTQYPVKSRYHSFFIWESQVKTVTFSSPGPFWRQFLFGIFLTE